MKRRVLFDPAASSGTPIAINTIPKNGGGNGKNINPTSRQIAPDTISMIDFKCLSLRNAMPIDRLNRTLMPIIRCPFGAAKRMFKDI
ncbi:hypothetical protein [Thalassospira australica]|uniref:hypothetical protein n=1 Tax=Thalassospira australica TaxID=1528106 RepID=UPI00138E1289|nr:hypothetical protein [Thalassospira australica]